MFTLLKIQTILKESCSKCKHTTAKAVSSKKSKKFTKTVILPKTNFESWLNHTKRIEQDERTINVRLLLLSLINLSLGHFSVNIYISVGF